MEKVSVRVTSSRIEQICCVSCSMYRNDSLRKSFRSLLVSMKNQAYNSMSEEGFDQKIPLHNEDAFRHGIHFNIKVKPKSIVINSNSSHLVYRFIRSTQTNKSNWNCLRYASYPCKSPLIPSHHSFTFNSVWIQSTRSKKTIC